MVVKTEICTFSGLKIYPGHGILYARSDSKSFKFINRKVKSCFHQKFNPRKLAWTMLYRRMHKKGTLEDNSKKKARKERFEDPRAKEEAAKKAARAERFKDPAVKANEAKLKARAERFAPPS